MLSKIKKCKLCSNQRFSKGLCSKHYLEYRKEKEKIRRINNSVDKIAKNSKLQAHRINNSIKNKHSSIWFSEQKLSKDEYIRCNFCLKNRCGEIHHIVYRSQGGTDEFSNLIGLCRSCHDRAHFKKQPYISIQELHSSKNIFDISRKNQLLHEKI